MIRLDHVEKTYRTRRGDLVRAVEDITLEVGENEFVTLVGASGCGKSTLLKMVAGLTPATRGTIHIRGAAVREPFPDVGFVFQQPVLLPWRRCSTTSSSPSRSGAAAAAVPQPAGDLLDLVGLGGFETAPPTRAFGRHAAAGGHLPGAAADPSLLDGRAIRRAGCHDAGADEPGAAAHWDERRKTILFITHSIPEAVLLADRVMLMSPRPGRVARVLAIDLPRPRTIDLEFDPRFKAASDAVRSLIFAGRAPAR